MFFVGDFRANEATINRQNRKSRITFWNVAITFVVLCPMLIGLYVLNRTVSTEFAVALALDIAILFAFDRLLPAYTQRGRDIADQLEGFKLFLTGKGGARFSTKSVEEAIQLFDQKTNRNPKSVNNLLL
jgi:hypothetical protein